MGEDELASFADRLAKELAPLVMKRVDAQVATIFAETSEAITGLLIAQNAVIGVLRQAGALDLVEVSAALERVLQTRTVQERQGKIGATLRELVKMIDTMDEVDLHG